MCWWDSLPCKLGEKSQGQECVEYGTEYKGKRLWVPILTRLHKHCVCVCVCVCEIWKTVKKKKLTCSQICGTPWTAAPQAPGPWDFPARILGWVAISSPGDLPDSGIQPASPASPALAGGFLTTELLGKSKS